PALTFQAYAQAFLASEHYEGVFAFPAGGTPVIHLSDLVPSLVNPAESPDIQEAALNANLLLRWEYRLGSTIYFVYTHAQHDLKTPYLGDEGDLRLRLLKPRTAADAFLFKLSYWWS